MRDSYSVNLLWLGWKGLGQSGDGKYSIFAKYTTDGSPDIPVTMGGTQADHIVGWANIRRLADNRSIMATVNFLKNTPAYPTVEMFWNRGHQVYCNPHMRRSYQRTDHNTDLEIICVDTIELQTWAATPPYYTAPLFSWP